MTDVRLLGRFRTAESVEALDQSQGRLILCSGDWARGAEKLVLMETSDVVKHPFFEAFPASNILDGNRETYAQAAVKTEWVRLTIDTGNTERKALLFIEYPEDEFIEPAELEMANESAGAWNSLLAGLTTLYQGRRYGLWSLPFSTASSSKKLQITGVTSAVEYTVGGGVSVGECFPQTGVNAGLSRRVTAGGDGYFILDRPFPSLLTIGVEVFIKEIRQSYLSGRYVRVKLRRKYHVNPETVPASEPMRVIGVSVFDCYLELKGDKANFRRHRAPNPSSMEREVQTGVIHRTLQGRARSEQWGGSKERITLDWQIAYSGFPVDLREWAGRGEVGLVDENHRYLQGFVEPGYSYAALPVDTEGRREISAKLVFQET